MPRSPRRIGVLLRYRPAGPPHLIFSHFVAALGDSQYVANLYTSILDTWCSTRHSTVAVTMLPFRIDFKPGLPLYEQVVYAATKSIISGQLRVGDEFPSVRALSRHLKINPNTAHKVITCLVDAGLLEIHAGSAAIVASRPPASKAEKAQLLREQFEQLVVEAKRLGIDLDAMHEALTKHWNRLDSQREGKSDPTKGGQ